MNNFIINSITIEDVDNLAVLHGACFTKEWDKKQLQELLNNGVKGLKIEHNEQLIGFVLFRPVLDEAEIISLGVLPEWRKQGLAKNLIAEMLNAEVNQDINKIFLEVEVFNQSAIKLYKNFGFEQTGIRKNYYEIAGSKIDALTMSWKR